MVNTAALSGEAGGEGVQVSKLRVLSLFAGIGGFDLGLERTGGFETVAFCEIDTFAQRVLAKHWPKVPCYDDVRDLTAARLAADGIAVDVICGGFPCQDISVAGSGEGLAGKRSGLWSEIARLAGELRPRFVIVENVAALLGRGLGTVLGDLAELGFDAEWHCIPASAVGAPHRRNRVWLVAYPGRARLHQRRLTRDAGEEGGKSGRVERDGFSQGRWGEGTPLADARIGRHWLAAFQVSAGRNGPQHGGVWASEPDVDRVAHGVPSRVDRLRCLGNAVVPQIPELIGNAILASMRTA